MSCYSVSATQTETHSLQLPIFINTNKHTTAFNTISSSFQHDLDRWFTGLQKRWCPMYPPVVAEDLEWNGFLQDQRPVSGAWWPWCQLTEATNEEGWGASGVPFETGAPGFHKRRPSIHFNSSVLRRKKWSPFQRDVVFHSGVMSNVVHTKALLPVCPLSACMPSQREMLLHGRMKLYMSRCISFKQKYTSM